MERYDKLLKQHIQMLANILDERFSEISIELSRVLGTSLLPNIPFSKYSEQKKKEILIKIEKVVGGFGDTVEKDILSFIKLAVELSEEKNNSISMKILKGAGLGAATSLLYSMFKKRTLTPAFEKLFYSMFNKKIPPHDSEKLFDAYKEIISRRIHGLTLSERVWDLSNGNKDIIEHYLRSGFADGKPARLIAADLKKFLKEPDKLFRRVRNEAGKLVLSQPARDYHPGQGVYRSSYKNALRLAATEINHAYRLNDHYRWKHNPAIVGFEVKLSGSHVVSDMCNDLAGKYPKDFVFTGWHPQCFCYAIPVILPDKEFDNYVGSIIENRPLDPPKSKSIINDTPDGFKQWIDNNKERIKKMKNKPYFINDNFKDGDVEKGLNID